MYSVEVDNINELLYEACNLVMMHGEEVESSVGRMTTKELHPFHATINNPKARTLLYPYRGNNPFATLFETLWVLGAKDNSIEYLKKYLPRCTDYSDDGKRWRAGYPERIRNYKGDYDWSNEDGVDQFKYVYEKLKADPESRQAVINLWNPVFDDFDALAEDNGTGLMESKDFPCSQNLTFLIRNGKLDCTFYIRSNDAIFGCTAINLYEFTVMQEILAGLLNVEVGKFYYYINSLHIYERHYDKAKVLITDGKPYSDFLVPQLCETGNKVTVDEIPVFNWYDKSETDYGCHMEIFEELYQSLSQDEQMEEEPISDVYEDIYRLCNIYQTYKDKEYSIDTWKKYWEDMKAVRFTDLKVSCHFWFMKHWKCVAIDRIDVVIQQMILMEEDNA